MSPSCFWIEGVAHAIYGPDETGWQIHNFTPEMAHMNIHHIGVPHVFITPDAIEEGLPGKDPPGVPHKELQESKLRGGESNRLTTLGDLPGFHIEH